MPFAHRLVAIINKELESGVALNALAHMTVGLGANIGKESLQLDTYVDADGLLYPHISQMPFIILRGTSNEIRKTIKAAREQNINHGAFLNTMTGGTYQQQLDTTRQTPEEKLVYYGCVLFGNAEKVTALTKKFSLWR